MQDNDDLHFTFDDEEDEEPNLDETQPLRRLRREPKVLLIVSAFLALAIVCLFVAGLFAGWYDQRGAAPAPPTEVAPQGAEATVRCEGNYGGLHNYSLGIGETDEFQYPIEGNGNRVVTIECRDYGTVTTSRSIVEGGAEVAEEETPMLSPTPRAEQEQPDSGQSEELETAEPQVDANETVVMYVPRPDAFDLRTEDGTMTGVVYTVGEKTGTTYIVPYGARWMIPGGNFDIIIGDDVNSYEATATQINLVGGTCRQESDCELTIVPEAAGHVVIVISWVDTLNEMFDNGAEQAFGAPNCGGSGCNELLAEIEGQREVFASFAQYRQFQFPELDQPEVTVTLIGSVPDDAAVILDGRGHVFELDDPDEFAVSVPEGGETYFVCRDECTINGTSHPQAIYRIAGNASDLFTPEDQNETVMVSSDDNVIVVFVYAQLPVVYDGQVKALVDQLAMAYELEVEGLNLFRQ